MRNPTLSVVMSVYNGDRFLRDAIESILAQTFRDFEFIIINDGSTDDTAIVLNEYENRDARLRVLHQMNHGLAVSLNTGICLAKGRYIARMDADDIAIADRLECQVDYMNRFPDLGAIGGAVHVIDSMGRVVGKSRFPTSDVVIKAELAVGGCPLCHPAVVMRTAAVRAVGGYRAVVVDAEDYDLWLRIADRYQLGNLERPVLQYRRHSGQVSVRRFRRQALSNLAARRAAIMRRAGGVDFLKESDEITSSLLERHGVTEDLQQAAVARGYLTCVASMIEAGEHKIALDSLRELADLPYWKRARGPMVADYHLLAARVHWLQGRVFAGLSRVVQGIARRPIVLARPLKPLLRRFGVNLRFDMVIARAKKAIRAQGARV